MDPLGHQLKGDPDIQDQSVQKLPIKREDIRGVWTWKIQLIEFNNLIAILEKETKIMN